MRSIDREPGPDLLGLEAPEWGWVPTPTYLLRRAIVLRTLGELPRGRILEIGCGSGALIHDLTQLGFRCAGVDTSVAAVELARHLNRDHPEVRIYNGLEAVADSEFDIVLAFEVLEHIEDDRQALVQWRSRLRSGGTMMLSVPAHIRSWSQDDVWAGHFRRYERIGLRELLTSTGFHPSRIDCYGFPLANLASFLRRRYHKLEPEQQDAGEKTLRTARSGIDRHTEMRFRTMQSSWLGLRLLSLGIGIQGLFLDKDWGPGYVVLAHT